MGQVARWPLGETDSLLYFVIAASLGPSHFSKAVFVVTRHSGLKRVIPESLSNKDLQV